VGVFDLGILKAINEWQRGGSPKQKDRRGQSLKETCNSLPDRFRTCEQICYRQEAHEKDRIWQLLANEALPESISSWTVSLSMAKGFKGGVPPAGLQGVIFAITPSTDQVVLNLVEIYADPEFQKACETHRTAIPGFASGIGKYGGSQSEIVLNVERLVTDQVFSYGGFSSSIEDLAALAIGHRPSDEELALFTATAENAAVRPGAWWLSTEGTRCVLGRMAPRLTALRAEKSKLGGLILCARSATWRRAGDRTIGVDERELGDAASDEGTWALAPRALKYLPCPGRHSADTTTPTPSFHGPP